MFASSCQLPLRTSRPSFESHGAVTGRRSTRPAPEGGPRGHRPVDTRASGLARGLARGASPSGRSRCAHAPVELGRPVESAQGAPEGGLAVSIMRHAPCPAASCVRYRGLRCRAFSLPAARTGESCVSCLLLIFCTSRPYPSCPSECRFSAG